MNILLDMDGVLSQFVEASCRFFGTTEEELIKKWPKNEYDTDKVLNVSNAEFWEKINGAGQKFWSEMPEYPWAKTLYEGCKKYGDVYFLTSPSDQPCSPAGKLEWIHRFTGNNKARNFLIGPPKFLCANMDHVLIDDSDKNCNAFAMAGGRTILFPQPWNCNYAEKDKLGYTFGKLEEIGNEPRPLIAFPTSSCI